MKHTVIATLFLNLLVVSLGLADDLSLTATVDRTRVGLEDQLTLTISASGSGFESLPEPELPALDNFDVLGTHQSSSSQFSIVNGKVSSSKTIDFMYYLSPRQAGTWKIGSAKLKYRGKTYTTEPIQVEVVTGTVQQRSQQTHRPRSLPADHDLDGEASRRHAVAHGRRSCRRSPAVDAGLVCTVGGRGPLLPVHALFSEKGLGLGLAGAVPYYRHAGRDSHEDRRCQTGQGRSRTAL